MYAKLSIYNAKKSIKHYLIYFITITICVSLFYALLSLSSPKYELITEDTFSFESLKMILKYSTYFISTVLIILVSYVNKYMIKRRLMEFATYILLGMEQKKVALMFFVEMLIVSVLSIICGVFLGVLFSQTVTAIIYNSINEKIIFEFRFYLDTVIITFLFFTLMYIIIGIYNILHLRKLKLIDMLNIQNQSEFKFRRSNKTYFIVFLISIIMYCLCGYYIYQIVGAENSALGIPTVVTIFFYFILGTYALFYSISYVIVLIKEKCINFKYKNTNLFLIGSLISKIKTAPILISTISLAFLSAAISFILILAMAQWSVGYLNKRVPFDVAIRNNNQLIKDIKDLPELNYNEIITYLEEKGYNITNFEEVEFYMLDNNDINKELKDRKPLAISLSDFNKLREMLGYEQTQLNENEFSTQWDYMEDEEDINKYIEEDKKLILNNRELKLSEKPYFSEPLDEGIYNYRIDNVMLFILPDNICKELLQYEKCFFATLDKGMSHEDATELEYTFLKDWFSENNPEVAQKYTSKTVYARIKSAETNEIMNAMLGMRIVAGYLAIILFMIGLTILSLQQLTDSIESKDRFKVLRQLGIEEHNINKIILKQVGIYFTAPIIVAMIGLIIFIFVFYKVASHIIKIYIGTKLLTTTIIVSVFVMLVLYLIYFLGTYFTFKRNIK